MLLSDELKLSRVFSHLAWTPASETIGHDLGHYVRMGYIATRTNGIVLEYILTSRGLERRRELEQASDQTETVSECRVLQYHGRH